MTTIADLVKDTRSRLSGTFSDELNTLAVPYVAGSGEIQFTYAANVSVGSVVSCEENTWYVVAGNTGGTTYQVIPSYDGGPDVDKAALSVVRLRPRATDWAILTAIRDQVMLMSSPSKGLGQINFWADQGGLTTTGQYEPPDGIVPARVHEVFGYDGQKWWRVNQFDYSLGSVRVYDDRWVGYMFVYSMPFGAVTGMAQDTATDIGLNDAMLDIPCLGAAGMVLYTSESRRGQLSAQGDPRRAADVQSGANMSAAREFMRLRDSRISDEQGRAVNVFALTGVSVA
jgi:hypothetical protein